MNSIALEQSFGQVSILNTLLGHKKRHLLEQFLN